MASTFKNFLNNDITSTRTLLHEAIPITGSIVSGTYLENADVETNIKNYSHGLFQSVYDYPHLSSSANHIFDLTVGYSNNCPISHSSGVQNTEKINLYNQMAQMLVGHDISGNVREFDRDGDFTVKDRNTKMDSCIFMNFSRLLVKDEIKKGSFKLELMTGSVKEGVVSANSNTQRDATPADSANGAILTLQDHGGTTSYKVNSPAGEYGILYSASADTSTGTTRGLGLVFYQAGIAVVTSSVYRAAALYDAGFTESTVFNGSTDVTNAGTYNGMRQGEFGMIPNSTLDALTSSVEKMFASASISASCGGLRNTLYNVEFNNTTELNSTIYFCRAGHNEYNYSSNPSYIDENSQIRVKNTTLDTPVSYITSIGLYSADNELLAVAKLSEPVKKTPENELTFRVRLDY
tara:strand:- start:26990 stop:28210 length:1221 start_codon:yes stop_codon:yes gene_type:complete